MTKQKQPTLFTRIQLPVVLLLNLADKLTKGIHPALKPKIIQSTGKYTQKEFRIQMGERLGLVAGSNHPALFPYITQ